MPLYSVKCSTCGRSDRVFRHVANRDDDLPVCHGVMARIIEAPAVQADLPGYQSPIDGRWVEGRRARTEDLKRSGCRPWEGLEAEKKEAVKRAQAADQQFEKAIEQGIAETYNGMSAEKQRALQTI